MASLSPKLTATPSTPPTYNVGMAETFSWIPVEGADRPLFARATYLANPEDIKVSLSAENINLSLDDLELNTDEVEGLIRTTNQTLTAFQAETDANIEKTNTLLSYLTATQDDSVSLLHALTANTDDLEELVVTNNTLLNSLTALTQSESNETQTLLTNEFNETQTLLNSLTALQDSKQSQIITLLHQLTANTDSLEINTDNVESLISGSNARLDALTAVDYATEAKQDSTITLLRQLTANTDSIESLLQASNTLLDSISAKEMTISLDVSAINLNTDEIEGLIQTSNTLLDSLTAKQTVTDVSGIETRLDALTAVQYATSSNQQSTNTLLNSLTALQEDKQSQIITLLHAVTGTSFDVDLTTDQINLNIDQVENLLNNLTATNIKVPGFSIPPYDEIDLSYYGTTNNLASVSYINNSTTVLSLSFVYSTNPPTTNDGLLVNVKKI